ncbi:GNAT family N-acetyltransferase [Pantoea agglomerans]|uniref:GNAT family N-acetyltransferase n=1 Tax=Enterobacter agglomerans TaxID=549 RepID=UPI0032092C98
MSAIFTLPEFGGLGYASQLIKKVKQEAHARGFTRLTLLATPNAKDFYVRHYFNVVRQTLHFSSLANAEMPCFYMYAEIQPEA